MNFSPAATLRAVKRLRRFELYNCFADAVLVPITTGAEIECAKILNTIAGGRRRSPGLNLSAFSGGKGLHGYRAKSSNALKFNPHCIDSGKFLPARRLRATRRGSTAASGERSSSTPLSVRRADVARHADWLYTALTRAYR